MCSPIVCIPVLEFDGRTACLALIFLAATIQSLLLPSTMNFMLPHLELVTTTSVCLGLLILDAQVHFSGAALDLMEAPRMRHGQIGGVSRYSRSL